MFPLYCSISSSSITALTLFASLSHPSPFPATTLPPISKPQAGAVEKAIRVSRERYTNKKDEVEEKIMRWSGLEETMTAMAEETKLDGQEAIFKKGHVTKAVANRDNKEVSSSAKAVEDAPPNAVCDNCNKGAHIKFTPDNQRNVFCKDCLAKFKKGEIEVSGLLKKNAPKKTEAQLEVIKPRQQLAKLGGQINANDILPQAQSLKPGEVVNISN